MAITFENELTAKTLRNYNNRDNSIAK